MTHYHKGHRWNSLRTKNVIVLICNEEHSLARSSTCGLIHHFKSSEIYYCYCKCQNGSICLVDIVLESSDFIY